uniref:Uncharacterized protein n=1 Tax=Oryza brachyantha TaxID=4533 RepID=J3NF30_ORYBR
MVLRVPPPNDLELQAPLDVILTQTELRCTFSVTLFLCMDGRKPASRVVKSILQMMQLSQAPLHFELKGETLEQQTLKYSSELLKAIESGTGSCGQEVA